MRIYSVKTSPAFGKIPVMTCKVKDKETKNDNNATLYKLDTNNPDDLNDVKYSKTAQIIKNDFFKAYSNLINYNNFYMLQNDKSGEVISCAKTSRHYRNEDLINPGTTTIIEKFGTNDNYIKAGEPLLAYIVERAKESRNNSVYAISSRKMPDEMQEANFTETEYEGISYLQADRFNEFINKAKINSNIDYQI